VKRLAIIGAAIVLLGAAILVMFCMLDERDNELGEVVMKLSVQPGPFYIEVHYDEAIGRSELIVYEGELDVFNPAHDSDDITCIEDFFSVIYRRSEVRLSSEQVRGIVELVNELEASGYVYHPNPILGWSRHAALSYNGVTYRMDTDGEGTGLLYSIVGKIVSLSPIQPDRFFWIDDDAIVVNILGCYNLDAFSDVASLSGWLNLRPDNSFEIRKGLDKDSELTSAGRWTSEMHVNIHLEEVHSVTLIFDDQETGDKTLILLFFDGALRGIEERDESTASTEIDPQLLEIIESLDGVSDLSDLSDWLDSLQSGFSNEPTPP